MDDAMEIGDSDFGTDMEGVMDVAGGTNEATPELDYPMDGDMSDVEDMLEYEDDEAGGALRDNTGDVMGDDVAETDVIDLDGDDEAGNDESAAVGEVPAADSAGVAGFGSGPASVPNDAPNMDQATAHAKSKSEAHHIHMQPGSPQQKKDKLPNQQHNEIPPGPGAVEQAGPDAVERATQAAAAPQGQAGARALGGLEDLSAPGPASAGETVPSAVADGASGPQGTASAAQAIDVDLVGADGAGDGLLTPGGADGARGVDHGPAADGGHAAGDAGAGAATGAGGDAAAAGVQHDQADVPADVHDGGAAAGASDAVHAADDDPAAGGHGEAAADSVAHEHAAAAVHGAHEPDAGQADGAAHAAAGQADGARHHVPGAGVDAGVEPAAGQDAAGLRGADDQGHERAAPEDGGLDGGDESEFAAEMQDLEDATTTSAVAESAADGGPGALATGVAVEELPLDEEASEALQGHADAAAAELADNTAEYYDQSLDIDLTVPVLVHFAEIGKTYLVSGEHADYPPLFEDLRGSELLEYSMEDVFGLMRRSLEGFCSMDEELVLTCRQLGLTLGEDNVCSKDATLMDLVRLFQTFAANTVDYQRPATFDMRLSLSQRFISNYNRLYSLAQQGHSLVDLSDLSRHVQQGSVQAEAEVAGGGNLGKEILGSNSAALEDEAQVAEETTRAQEASLEFAKQAFSGAKPSEDPEDALNPVLETNYLPLKRGAEEGEVAEGSESKKAKEE
ncbi:hypothetical protein CJU90_4364 [Yarrowia sp. C11]|nr:hypothetical protein CJU90_4364 [Yarrowia sp. C11]